MGLDRRMFSPGEVLRLMKKFYWLGPLVLVGCFSPTRQMPEKASEDVDWNRLDRFQISMDRNTFVRKLDTIYSPNAPWKEWISVTPDAAWIRTSADDPEQFYQIRFAGRGNRVPELRSDLRGMTIAIDPGHIGGDWGPMEARSFSVNGGGVVQEGDLVLAAARRIAAALEARGAKAVLVRDGPRPVTTTRPDDFVVAARAQLTSRSGVNPDTKEVKQLAERMFYRTAEIEARAEKINREIRPDLVIALHIDAAAWPNPELPELVARNDGHVLVNGCYLPSEIAQDRTRFEMLWRLMNRYDEVEIPLADSLAQSMAARTGLPAAVYTGINASHVSENPYVWARNLMANRIYDCPVVYLEPWIANSVEIYPWAAMGDYQGSRRIAGHWSKSLPAAYADFVIRGLEASIGKTW